MFCVNCGSKIEEGQNFCTSCGKARESSNVNRADSNMQQQMDGANNSNTTVAVKTNDVKAQPNKSNKNRNRNIIIAALILLVVLAKMGVIDTSPVTGSLFSSKNKDPKAPIEKVFQGALDVNSKKFLSAFHERQVDAIRREYRNYYSDEFTSFDHYMNTMLAELKRELNNQGVRSIRDITIIQPPNHKNLMRTEVRIMFMGEDDMIDVIKINGQWYIDGELF